MRLIFSLSLLFLLIFNQKGISQFNVKVGYGLAYTTATGNNQIIEAFNLQNDFRLEKPMSEIHLLHGLELGLRYRFENLGIEFSWEPLGNSTSGLGEDVDRSLFQKELFYSFKTISIGLEGYFGNKGIGFSLGNRKMKVKSEIAESGSKKTLLDKDQWTMKLYWMINFKGRDYIGLSMRPYIQWPINQFGFDQQNSDNSTSYRLHDYLEIEVPQENEIKDRIPLVGLSILFYNGMQKN